MQNLDFIVRKNSNITLLTLNHFTQKRVWIETFITANKWVYLKNLKHFGRRARQLLFGRQEGAGWCPKATSSALEPAHRSPLLWHPSLEEPIRPTIACGIKDVGVSLTCIADWHYIWMTHRLSGCKGEGKMLKSTQVQELSIETTQILIFFASVFRIEFRQRLFWLEF